MFTMFRQLEKDEFLLVASREEIEDALQLKQAFNTDWPGEYVIRDAEGNDIYPNRP